VSVPLVTLAIDLGTSGVKVALVDEGGRVLGFESVPVRLLVTPDGGAEQVPDEWWSGLLDASRRLLARELCPRAAVRAVCCSTQGEGTIPVDRDGRALMNCVLWMDMRGAEPLRRQFRGVVNVAGASAWRVLRWIRLTGGMPSMTGKDPAGHMLLVRDRFPDVYARTHKFLNVLDYLNLRLTGRFVATHDSILTSWVTDNRDVDRVRYHPALVRGCGVDAEKLPEIVPCTAVIGPLLPAVADALGLSRDVPVVAGAIDNTAAAVGSGATEDRRLHLYLGTSTWMAAHVPHKKTDLASALASVPCALPGRWLLTALQATAGGNLSFLRDKVLYHRDELLQEAGVPDVFKVMDRMAARVPAGSRGVLYTPWIWGERAPVEDRTLRAGLFNLSLENDRADVIRAFLEGVALNSRWLLSPVEKFLGEKVRELRLVGGGASSDVWCQIYADVLGVDVHQVQDPLQANARGAGLIAAAALGRVAWRDVPALAPVRRTYHPNPDHRRLYDERFDAFREVYRRMRGVYRQLNGAAPAPAPAASSSPRAAGGASLQP
jgi:xylulokinase